MHLLPLSCLRSSNGFDPIAGASSPKSWMMRPKRPASEHLAGEHGNKHFRASSSSAQGAVSLKWIVSKLDPLA
ncbi:hypothetical protein F2Q68_00027022 [Brassica cretica]|uniref:Uncharacterized protein n=1 Tax=Brassica cretica TaxID=69181 RepID=A0A8S9ICK8_BRACR|nr:hypothetical protein F2Q68_00027022 [Brassica cretica]